MPMVFEYGAFAQRSVRRVFSAVALAALAFACGGPGTGPCPLQNWSGVCDLTNFTRLRDVEFPVPHSVYEAMYTPVANADSPNYSPPVVRIEIQALSKHEPALQQHLQANRRIACQQTIRDGCAYNPVVASFPEFDPNRYAQAAPTGPEGCEKVEGQASASIGQRSSETLPEQFQFVHNSSTVEAAMSATAQTVAQRLASDPSIECVGVVGQSAAGESPGVSELRAQAIKRLLAQAGVAPKRMMTVSTSTPLYGAGNEREAPKPEDQRVNITIILRAGAPAPGSGTSPQQ